MELTDDMLKILQEGFEKNDITQTAALPGMLEIPEQEAEVYKFFEETVTEYMNNCLPELGIKRNLESFSSDYPVRLLMEADAQVIAEKASKIIMDTDAAEKAASEFLDRFAPLIELAGESYCNFTGKSEDELTEDDCLTILNRVATAANEELLPAVLQGQKIKEISDLLKETPAHQDYPKRQTPDSINFHHKWSHDKTAVGAMIPFDEIDEIQGLVPDTEQEVIDRVRLEEFMDTLNEQDRKILELRLLGKTQKQIAEILGYHTHSAVGKRLQYIRQSLSDSLRESD